MENHSANHTQAGYPGIQHSGNDISFAPWPAASSMRLQVFLTDAFRSSHSGSAWVTATRTVFDNMLSFDWLSAMSLFEEKGDKEGMGSASWQCACIHILLASILVADTVTASLLVYISERIASGVIAVEFQMAQAAAPANLVRRIPRSASIGISYGARSATRLRQHCTLYGDLPCGIDESRPMSTHTAATTSR
jgi:hypothetical protein